MCVIKTNIYDIVMTFDINTGYECFIFIVQVCNSDASVSVNTGNEMLTSQTGDYRSSNLPGLSYFLYLVFV